MIDFSNLTDIDDEYDELDDLDDLFEDGFVGNPTKDQMFQLYGVFLKDIVNNPIVINGVELIYNKNKSRHPLCKGKMQAFEHIITRENKYKGRREFDAERANKIHWIRPILENRSDPRIKYFERINDDGHNQQFYWYEEKSFIIIIREIKPDYFLITSFSVDTFEKPKYKRYYDEYRQK